MSCSGTSRRICIRLLEPPYGLAVRQGGKRNKTSRCQEFIHPLFLLRHVPYICIYGNEQEQGHSFREEEEIVDIAVALRRFRANGMPDQKPRGESRRKKDGCRDGSQ